MYCEMYLKDFSEKKIILELMKYSSKISSIFIKFL